MTRKDQVDELPQPWRETPLIHSSILSKHAGCQIYLKLENLQLSGSFKARGLGNFIRSHLSNPADPQAREKTHFFTSSGGNAGLACVYAAVSLNSAATVVVPLTTSDYMISKIRAAGANEVIQDGASWAEADQYLRKVVMPASKARGEVPVYVPPFDAKEIWEGHSTLITEISQQLGGDKPPDAVICSVGGGGLFCGITQGLEKVGWSGVPILAVETEGAHSLALSVDRRQLTTLPAITSKATTLGARTVAQQAFEYAQRESVKCIVLQDSDAMEGCVRFADDERIMVELSCGVCLSLCYNGRLKEHLPGLNEQSRVVIVVCGGSNTSVEALQSWASQG